MSLDNVDISHFAMRLLMKNYKRLQVHYFRSQHLTLSSPNNHLFDILDGVLATANWAHKEYDIIVCNPPYIPKRDAKRLPYSVSLWEDRDALTLATDPDGLLFYQKIIPILPYILSRHGISIFEGNDQRQLAMVRLLAEQHGLATDLLPFPGHIPVLKIWRNA